mmetsp:Transcript_6306/g.13232  ORF Transcript_6306/g.13232 Transcript_6306/m.13232 type:complete len:313 (-) Transcript_6306:868-1806(-)
MRADGAGAGRTGGGILEDDDHLPGLRQSSDMLQLPVLPKEGPKCADPQLIRHVVVRLEHQGDRVVVGRCFGKHAGGGSRLAGAGLCFAIRCSGTRLAGAGLGFAIAIAVAVAIFRGGRGLARRVGRLLAHPAYPELHHPQRKRHPLILLRGGRRLRHLRRLPLSLLRLWGGLDLLLLLSSRPCPMDRQLRLRLTIQVDHFHHIVVTHIHGRARIVLLPAILVQRRLRGQPARPLRHLCAPLLPLRGKIFSEGRGGRGLALSGKRLFPDFPQLFREGEPSLCLFRLHLITRQFPHLVQGRPVVHSELELVFPV